MMECGEDVGPLLLLLNNLDIGSPISSREVGGGGWTVWVVELGHLTLLMINQLIWSSNSLHLHSGSQLCELFAIPVALTRESGCARCVRRGYRGVLWTSNLIVGVIYWWNQ